MKFGPRSASRLARVGWTAPVSSVARLCSAAGPPSQVQGSRNRVRHFGSTGSCSAASCQVDPSSVETSTRAIRPRPDQARPLTSWNPGWPGPRPGGGPGDHGFHLHDEVELLGGPIGQQAGVLRRFLARLKRLVAELQAVQPFHVHVALVARQEQAQQIAVLRPQALAVLCVGQDGVVQRLLDRHRAGHRGGVCPLRQHPRGAGSHPGFGQDIRKPHAGPLRAAHLPMGVLHGPVRLDLLGLVQRGVARAFQEVQPGHGGKAGQVVHAEAERALDQPVHQQPVAGRINRGSAGVAADVVQAVRRDDANQVLQRRVRGCGGHERRSVPHAPHHRAFEWRRAAIGRVVRRGTLPGHPGRRVQGWFRRSGADARCCGRASQGPAHLLQHAPPPHSCGPMIRHGRSPRAVRRPSPWPRMPHVSTSYASGEYA